MMKKNTYYLILERSNERLIDELDKTKQELQQAKEALLKIATVDYFDHKTSKELQHRHLWLWSKMQRTARECLAKLGFTIVEK